MKRLSAAIVAAVMGLGAGVYAGEPQLPAGHPQLPQASDPKLPSGHPQLPASSKGKPGEHDIVRSDEDLPAGHPSLKDILPKGVSNGTLKVRATQGTKDGGPLKGDAVVVQFYSQGEILRTLQGKLNDKGEVEVGKLSLPAPAAALVRVTHAGSEFQTLGGVIDDKHAALGVDVSVFESTEQRPAWQLKAVHLMVQPDGEGLHVLHMFNVENPTDRAWVGVAVAGGAAGERETFGLALPAGATDLNVYAGFIQEKVKVDGDRIVNLNAISPGVTQYKIGYTVPAKDGKAVVTLATPAPVGKVMVFVQDDGRATITPVGMEASKSAAMAGANVRSFTAQNVAAGAPLKLTFEGLKAPAQAAVAR